ncbi:L-serine dehydratase/L-threonine deaminase-like [Gigantopelta aegis]|uniref:L-serine dehydratase/L-threonine deaminase-like n=1 Tax=Gigantopelta aegis TaxID=1735272 RepID=UPI001B88CD72|nr:L-serine dehydratase/L-threonine deaminase-like [Gigantopelta aegis]
MTDRGGQLYITTPTVESDVLSRPRGFRVFLKLENLQPPGSFKIRGISHLCQKAVKEKGCTHLYCASGGNAGLATAYVAQRLNLKCTVVLPESTPPFVADKLKEMGATVLIHGKVWDEANEHAQKLAQNPDAQFVPPFDHPVIWEGHGSMIKEAAEQMPSRPDVIVTCVGGGGLLNGVVIGMKSVGWQDVPIIAMETVGADCFNKSVVAGQIITLPGITSVAVCLGAKAVNEHTFRLYRDKTANIISVAVPDKEAVKACLRFADDHRFIVEPACGATLSCIYSDVIPQLQSEGRLGKVNSALVIVCGGAGVSLDLLYKWKKQFDL